MRKLFNVMAAAGVLALVQPAVADQALATANGCMACHQMETKVVGPAYKDVAAKYKGDAGAKDMLIGKVRNGGSGTWGEIPMPPNAAISDADLDAVVTWILAQ